MVLWTRSGSHGPGVEDPWDRVRHLSGHFCLMVRYIYWSFSNRSDICNNLVLKSVRVIGTHQRTSKVKLICLTKLGFTKKLSVEGSVSIMIFLPSLHDS